MRVYVKSVILFVVIPLTFILGGCAMSGKRKSSGLKMKTVKVVRGKTMHPPKVRSRKSTTKTIRHK